jgi:two-component system OmpR family response regulator
MGKQCITVVYVEDDPDIREVVELAFELTSDMRLTCCDPSAAVLDLIRSQMPDLVLLDVMMPGTDGITLARQIRADVSLRDIPFAFITAKAMPQELEQLRALGAIGVISKPFNALTLVSEVRNLITGSVP